MAAGSSFTRPTYDALQYPLHPNKRPTGIPIMPDSPILEGLNEAQRRAVTAGTGPYLILAGPIPPERGRYRHRGHVVVYV
jgi:hypothetical protein